MRPKVLNLTAKDELLMAERERLLNEQNQIRADKPTDTSFWLGEFHLQLLCTLCGSLLVLRHSLSLASHGGRGQPPKSSRHPQAEFREAVKLKNRNAG